MPTLIEAAKKPIKVGSAAPAWRLYIGGTNMTNKLISAEATFTASGESGLTMQVAQQLYHQSREREPVSLNIGYGTNIAPFFSGRLSQPKDSRSGIYSDATAYGPSGTMGTRYFRARVSYANMDAQAAGQDIWNRAMSDDDSGALYQWNAPSTTLEGDMEQFGFEHTFLEAEQAVLEPLGLVGVDQPGGYHTIKQPLRMDQVTRGNLVGIFGEDSYPKDPGFSFGESTRNIYNNVIVARRSEEYAGGSEAGTGAGMQQGADGKWFPTEVLTSDANILGTTPDPAEYAVYAERPVLENGQLPAYRRRAYIIPDFPGTQASAGLLAEHIAASLAIGVGRFEFECSPVDFALYDVFGVERTEQVVPAGVLESNHYTGVGPVYNVLYACQVEEITLTIGPSTFRMTVSGAAAERGRTLVSPGGFTGISSGVVAA